MEDPGAFIRSHLKLTPAPSFSDIQLFRAHPGSRLSEHGIGPAPFWAYLWAGGAALARHISLHPQDFAHRRVLDFGCGSGFVAIAAARVGARVWAADIDPFARAAAALNAEANDVAVTVIAPRDPRPEFEIVLAGDVFYDRRVAGTSLAALDRYLEDGARVLIGDPGRRDLPLHRLLPLAAYEVPDFGIGAGSEIPAKVYALQP